MEAHPDPSHVVSSQPGVLWCRANEDSRPDETIDVLTHWAPYAGEPLKEAPPLSAPLQHLTTSYLKDLMYSFDDAAADGAPAPPAESDAGTEVSSRYCMAASWAEEEKRLWQCLQVIKQQHMQLEDLLPCQTRKMT